MNKEYKRTFQFGKVAAYSKNKTNLVELEITLKIEGEKRIFSATGSVWNSVHSDIIQGGQCIDSVYNEFKGQLKNRKTYEAIMALWEKWHLNDMNAGCEHQRAAKWGELLIDPSKPYSQDNARGWKTYEEIVITEKQTACKTCGKTVEVEKHTGEYNDGLLGKPCEVCGYKYGTAWKYREIDKKDLREICQLLQIDFQEQNRILNIK